MQEKASSDAIEQISSSSASDEGISATATAPASHLVHVDVNAPRKRYFFGAQGKSLMRAISAAGTVGFLLFGYDQGVLGVSRLAMPRGAPRD